MHFAIANGLTFAINFKVSTGNPKAVECCIAKMCAEGKGEEKDREAALHFRISRAGNAGRIKR